MGRELRRLLIPPERLGEPSVALSPAEHHYLVRVLRYRPGARFAVVDGCGRLWSARLEAGACAALEQPPSEPLQRQDAPVGCLQLAAALPRREAELVVRMATELGIDRLQPLVAEHSSLRPPLPLERWNAIAREAAEQCERLWLPQLAAPEPALGWLRQRPQGTALLATTRRDDLPQLGAWLKEPAAPAAGGTVTLAIGPEGGWSTAEEQAALAAGWQPVSLGATILRAATAAVAGAALLQAWRARTWREQG